MTAASFRKATAYWVIGAFVPTICMAQIVVASDFWVGSEPKGTTAIPAATFLNSIGVDTTFPDRGQPLDKTIELPFLTIPAGAGTLLPEGTRDADFVTVSHDIYHPNSAGPPDNETWNAADPTAACKVDGLYGNHGVTWAKHDRGYSETGLLTLPRVTTETGCTVDGPVTEQVQALNF